MVAPISSKSGHAGGKDRCPCVVCDLLDKGLSMADIQLLMLIQQKSDVERYGWYAHVVMQGANTPTGYDMHTHGLAEKSEHADFQIVLPMATELAHTLLKTLVHRVQAGEKFKDGDVVERVCGDGYKVKLVSAVEAGRPVLRVILPDPEGRLARNEIGGDYARQYEDLDS